jgi:hypothetical protein
MHRQEKTLDPSQDGLSKLLLIGLCVAFMTAAIAQQLPAQAAHSQLLVASATP